MNHLLLHLLSSVTMFLALTTISAQLAQTGAIQKGDWRGLAATIGFTCSIGSSAGLYTIAATFFSHGIDSLGTGFRYLSLFYAVYALLFWNDDNWFRQRIRHLKRRVKAPRRSLTSSVAPTPT